MSTGADELRVPPLDVPDPSPAVSRDSSGDLDVQAALERIERQQRELEAIKALLLERRETSELQQEAQSPAEPGQWPAPLSVPADQALGG